MSADPEALESSGELDDLKALDGETAEVLVSVARAMYPHDHISDKHYARVVVSLDEKAAEDDDIRSMLELGIQCRSTLTGRWLKDFGSLDEGEQVSGCNPLVGSSLFLKGRGLRSGAGLLK